MQNYAQVHAQLSFIMLGVSRFIHILPNYFSCWDNHTIAQIVTLATLKKICKYIQWIQDDGGSRIILISEYAINIYMYIHKRFAEVVHTPPTLWLGYTRLYIKDLVQDWRISSTLAM